MDSESELFERASDFNFTDNELPDKFIPHNTDNFSLSTIQFSEMNTTPAGPP